MKKTLTAAFLFITLASGCLYAGLPDDDPIDINDATQRELESLPGIGPALAQRIIEFREKNGDFEQIEDLLNVRGIGLKKFEKLKKLIQVRSVRTRRRPAGP